MAVAVTDELIASLEGFQGSLLRPDDAAYEARNVLGGVTVVSPTDVWAVGMFENENTSYHQQRTLTEHWNGARWSLVASPSPGKSAELSAVASTPSGAVFAAGMWTAYDINIYDGTYTDPQTLVLAR